jgi:transcriptional regulator with GAF, ATPase, and Fis domain
VSDPKKDPSPAGGEPSPLSPFGKGARIPLPGSKAAVERGAAPDLKRLTEIARALNSEPDLRRLLDLVLDRVVDLANAERAFLLLRTADRKWEVAASRSLDREGVRRAGAKVSRSIVLQAEKTGKPILTTNATMDPRFAGSESVAFMKLRAVLCLPMSVRGRSLGVLYLDNRFEEGVFQSLDLGLLEAFAAQAAIALENARLHQENLHRQKELERAKEKVEELNKILKDQVRRQSAELAQVRQVLRDRHGDAPLGHPYPEIVGRSRKMMELLRLLDRVVGTEVPVLIHGESGTGKELVARAVHFLGSRAKGPFVTENCSAIPESLLESELFGYVKGAFTGADKDKTGLLEQATNGTLFLDEIGDMTAEMQSKLLRVLEVGEVRPVGAKKVVPVDVRVVAASHRDLRRMVREGTFREDLFYRLAVITVEVPPLRERREDIPILVEHFLDLAAADTGGHRRQVTEEALQLLQSHDWPGNVRELRNEILRACALADRVIVPEVLSPELRSGSVRRLLPERLDDRPLKELVRDTVESVERKVIADTLGRTGWLKTEAARALGVSRPTLDAKIAQYGLDTPGDPKRAAGG